MKAEVREIETLEDALHSGFEDLVKETMNAGGFQKVKLASNCFSPQNLHKVLILAQ